MIASATKLLEVVDAVENEASAFEDTLTSSDGMNEVDACLVCGTVWGDDGERHEKDCCMPPFWRSLGELRQHVEERLAKENEG